MIAPAAEARVSPQHVILMNWTEHRLTSWSDFHEKVLDAHAAVTVPLKASYIYRGQSRAEWSLAPSFTRLCERLGYDRARAIEIEKLLVRRFKERAHLVLEQHLLPAGAGSLLQVASLTAWWSLMQHYHAPTRPLDWTHSPLVALYFAVKDNWDSDGAIWSLHRRSLWERSDALYGAPPEAIDHDEEQMWWTEEPRGRVYSFDTPRPTDRMISQQGCFTVAQDVLIDHASGIATAVPEKTISGEIEHLWRRKFVIAKEVKPNLLRRLHQMYIGAGALFPGVDGFGAELEELVRMG